MVIRFTCILTSIVAGPLALAAIDLFPLAHGGHDAIGAPGGKTALPQREISGGGSVCSARRDSCVVA